MNAPEVMSTLVALGSLLPRLGASETTNELCRDLSLAASSLRLAAEEIPDKHFSVQINQLSNKLADKALQLTNLLSMPDTTAARQRTLEVLRRDTRAAYRILVQVLYPERGTHITPPPLTTRNLAEQEFAKFKRAHTIHSIAIQGLFGTSKREFNLSSEAHQKLVIFYGDNGSGKTTILKLLFHALGPEDTQGHRTFLLRAPFAQLRIGTGPLQVDISRLSPDSDDFGYVISSKTLGEPLATCRYFKDPESGKADSIGADTLLLSILERYAPRMRILRESRIPSDENSEVIVDNSSDLNMERARFSEMRQRAGTALQRRQRSPVLAAIARLEEYVRNETLRASQAADVRGSEIHERILETLLQQQDDPRLLERTTSDKLSQVQRHIEWLQAIHLAPRTRIPDISSILSVKDAVRKYTALQVLSSYLDSVQVRVDALSKVARTVQTFTESINEYFAGTKTVILSPTDGFKIFTTKGSQLHPNQLSSGERQLLLMFATIVVAPASSVFLIDEPELSLNVKWQKRFLSTLINLGAQRNLQFIIATHSLEMIANYREHWVRL